MKEKLTLLVCTFMALFVLSCEMKQEEVPSEQKDAVARAYDKWLTKSELSEMIPDNSSVEDSTALAQRFINNWLKEQSVLHRAEKNLPQEQQGFEKELEEFRRSLLTYAYESQLIEQRLNTEISPEEMEAYYENNKDIFRLKDYIVKAKYCILEESLSKPKRFEKLFYSDDAQDLVRLEQYCVDQGINYYLDTENWLFFEDLLQAVPIEVYSVNNLLKSNKSIRFERDQKVYYVKFIEYELKDNYSPLTLVENQIRNLILNRRKQELLSQLREDLYRDDLSKKNIENLTE